MKAVFATLLLLTLILSSSFLHCSADASPSFCGTECDRRCAKAGVKDRCLKYCGICCKACNCVPSGTYGHKDECPCYRDLKNSKGNPKCP